MITDATALRYHPVSSSAIWESRSNGRCLFIMPKGGDFAAIRALVQQRK